MQFLVLPRTGVALVASLHAQKMKVGYWTSGFSLGFGSVLEQMKFAEKEGLDVEWIKFAEVNGPTRAIVSQGIDLAFAAPSTASMQIAGDGVPGENRARDADTRRTDRRPARLADQIDCRSQRQENRHVAARQRHACHHDRHTREPRPEAGRLHGGAGQRGAARAIPRAEGNRRRRHTLGHDRADGRSEAAPDCEHRRRVEEAHEVERGADPRRDDRAQRVSGETSAGCRAVHRRRAQRASNSARRIRSASRKSCRKPRT